jgi:hypothetical protein
MGTMRTNFGRSTREETSICPLLGGEHPITILFHYQEGTLALRSSLKGVKPLVMKMLTLEQMS